MPWKNLNGNFLVRSEYIVPFFASAKATKKPSHYAVILCGGVMSKAKFIVLNIFFVVCDQVEQTCFGVTFMCHLMVAVDVTRWLFTTSIFIPWMASHSAKGAPKHCGGIQLMIFFIGRTELPSTLHIGINPNIFVPIISTLNHFDMGAYASI